MQLILKWLRKKDFTYIYNMRKNDKLDGAKY